MENEGPGAHRFCWLDTLVAGATGTPENDWNIAGFLMLHAENTTRETREL